jgi:transposase
LYGVFTLFVDIGQARVLFATEGCDAATAAKFADDLTVHGGDPDQISEVCIDMSPAFSKGTAGSLPKAAVTFDRFHGVKIVNDALDQVRRAERKTHILLKGRFSRAVQAEGVVDMGHAFPGLRRAGGLSPLRRFFLRQVRTGVRRRAGLGSADP